MSVDYVPWIQWIVDSLFVATTGCKTYLHQCRSCFVGTGIKCCAQTLEVATKRAQRIWQGVMTNLHSFFIESSFFLSPPPYVLSCFNYLLFCCCSPSLLCFSLLFVYFVLHNNKSSPNSTTLILHVKFE